MYAHVKQEIKQICNTSLILRVATVKCKLELSSGQQLVRGATFSQFQLAPQFFYLLLESDTT